MSEQNFKILKLINVNSRTNRFAENIPCNSNVTIIINRITHLASNINN